MKYISDRELRRYSAIAWKKLIQDKDIVVTSDGRPVAILSPVVDGEFEQEIRVIRRARAMVAIESMHADSLRSGGDRLSIEEINREIASVRKRRRK